jgi:hypothetical protein
MQQKYIKTIIKTLFVTMILFQKLLYEIQKKRRMTETELPISA